MFFLDFFDYFIDLFDTICVQYNFVYNIQYLFSLLINHIGLFQIMKLILIYNLAAVV